MDDDETKKIEYFRSVAELAEHMLKQQEEERKKQEEQRQKEQEDEEPK